MNSKNTTRILLGLGLLAIAAAFVFGHHTAQETAKPVVTTKPQTTTPPIVKDENIQTGAYTTLTIKTATPLQEITDAVGAENVPAVLKLNRINSNFLKTGSTVILPPKDADFDSLSPFPTNLPDATDIPKLMMVSQKIQAFGLYEHGMLVRWGPVSTGKEATQTASKLYFTNWKGKEVHSSFSDEWILKWNFNLDNKEGIGMHQYEMPGYPASHSCVRMFATDAEWIYNWADQWILSDDEQAVRGSGTPVIVFGTYAYGKTAPWKNLAKDPEATTLSQNEADKALSASLKTIQEKQEERASIQ